MSDLEFVVAALERLSLSTDAVEPTSYSADIKGPSSGLDKSPPDLMNKLPYEVLEMVAGYLVQAVEVKPQRGDKVTESSRTDVLNFRSMSRKMNGAATKAWASVIESKIMWSQPSTMQILDRVTQDEKIIPWIRHLNIGSRPSLSLETQDGGKAIEQCMTPDQYRQQLKAMFGRLKHLMSLSYLPACPRRQKFGPSVLNSETTSLITAISPSGLADRLTSFQYVPWIPENAMEFQQPSYWGSRLNKEVLPLAFASLTHLTLHAAATKFKPADNEFPSLEITSFRIMCSRPGELDRLTPAYANQWSRDPEKHLLRFPKLQHLEITMMDSKASGKLDIGFFVEQYWDTLETLAFGHPDLEGQFSFFPNREKIPKHFNLKRFVLRLRDQFPPRFLLPILLGDNLTYVMTDFPKPDVAFLEMKYRSRPNPAGSPRYFAHIAGLWDRG